MRNSILVSGLVLLVAAAWNLQADPPSPGGKTPVASQERIQKLIEQLGSKRFSEREQADRELETIGPAALELLKRAAQGPDPEIRRRTGKLVSKLEQHALAVEMLAPKRLRLAVTDASVKEAVAALAKLSGYPVQLGGEQAGLSDRKVTLDTGEVTFWEALDQLCRKAGLAEPIHASRTPAPAVQGQGGVITVKIAIRAKGAAGPVAPGANPAGRPASPELPLLLTAGKQPDLPVALAGAVRIRVLPADRVKGGSPVPAGETELVLEAAAEPRLQGFRVVSTALVNKAIDDQGQTLKTVFDPNAGPALPANPLNGRNGGPIVIANGANFAVVNGQVFVNGVPQGSDSLFAGPPQRTVAVRLKLGEKAAKSLRELSGTLIVSALKDGDVLVVVDNILKAAGQTIKGKNDRAIEIQAVERLANGDVKIRVSLEKPAGPNPFAGVGVNIAINGVQMGGPNAGSPPEWPRLLDAKGQAFLLAEVSGQQQGVNNNTTFQRATLVYRPEGRQGEPARLALHGKRPVALVVPFTLKNIPFGGAQQ